MISNFQSYHSYSGSKGNVFASFRWLLNCTTERLENTLTDTSGKNRTFQFGLKFPGEPDMMFESMYQTALVIMILHI